MNRPTAISDKQILVDGLAFDKEIIWGNWKPGVTYLKHINVHNCSAKVKECNYFLPDTADFQTVYPRRWKKIAAGSVFRLPILFKPTEEKVYESRITLRIKDQKRVHIGLRAILPEVNISVPTKLDFGPVGVDDTKMQIFTIRNMSNLETSFAFKLTAPFQINTLSGILMPLEKKMVEMTFSPTESGAYEQEAYCTYGPESNHCVTMYLSGIGEYPGLKFSLDDSTENDDHFRAGKELELKFPVIASGSITTKFLKVANRSKTNATLSIKSLSKDAGFEAGCLFSTTICQSVIRPQTELEIPSAVFQLTATTIQTHRQMQNKQCASVFPILDGPMNGILGPQQRIRLIMGFVPSYAGHFYRRITLLVANQTEMDQFYATEFEGFATFLSQKDCTLCQEEEIRPPSCLLVNCFGHTFSAEKEPHLPHFTISKNRIRFPAMELGEVQFEAITVSNKSDRPLFVQHLTNQIATTDEPDRIQPSNRVIQLIPPTMLIPPESQAILIFRCDSSYLASKPAGDIPINSVLMERLSFNCRHEYELTMPMEITISRPTLMLESNGELYFPPTQASTYFSVCAQQPIEREVNSPDYEHNESNVMSVATAAAYVLPREGWIAGLSSMSIVVNLKPTRSGPQRFQLCYQLWTPKLNVRSAYDALTTADVERTILTELVPSATILLMASYPTLRITDIQGLGTLGSLGAVELWRDLALDYLNSSLAASPSKEELRDSIATRTTYRDHPHKNKDRGPLRVEADRLFSIEPKRAFLKPGEVVQVCITFRHQLPGSYQLPVLLKVEGGREIKLRFLGLTLPRNQPYLHFAQRRHVFPAVALSDGDNRFGYLYSLQFRNPSARPARFNIGPLMWPQDADHPCSSAMLEGTVEGVTDGVGGCEFDMPVLYCCTLQGIVLPGEVFKLDWRFRPMEAKTYTALCPVHISDASIGCAQPEGETSQYEDTILLELVAIAYDLRQLERPHVPANPHRVRLPTANEQHILKVSTFPDSFLVSGEHSAQPMPRRIRLPGYPVSLSHHLLDLGRIAFGARARRLIHLVYSNTEENTHLTHSHGSRTVPSAYRFTLCTRVPDDIQFIDIKPNCGKIYPGQTVQLELTVTATSMPRFVDIQLQCQLFDEDRELEYTEELKSWQRELERQQDEFVIAHPNKAQRRPPQFTESAASFLKQLKDQRSNELDPHRTTELIVSGRVWPKPSPPLPTLLHITVTAHLVGQNETQHDHTNTLIKQFRDSTLFLHPAHSLSNVLTRTGYQEELTQTQWVLCSDILSTILSGLLDDVEFVKHIRETACPEISWINDEQSALDRPDDPVPYWTQLKQPVRQNVIAMDSDRASNDKTFSEELEINSKDQIIETLHRFQPNVSVPWLKCNPQVDSQSEQMTEREMESKCMRNPAFHNVVEDTLTGLLHNILAEAMKNEVDLTARFRVIALPPSEREPTT
ncbi:hypothetical protein AHF37_00163 [Paragonimus kellicotti]|nr:hypothetical protein AHF37_00163 [Paragonimus kellicotti]